MWTSASGRGKPHADRSGHGVGKQVFSAGIFMNNPLQSWRLDWPQIRRVDYNITHLHLSYSSALTKISYEPTLLGMLNRILT